MSPQTAPLVHVIVLCYNESKWLERNFESLLATNYPNFKAVLVDNASVDNSVELTKEKFPDVRIIQNQKNLGFAEGNNVGIRYALQQGADYIILLNADTHVHPDWIAELVAVGEANRDIGIITSMLYDYDAKGIDRNCMQLVKSSSPLIQDLWRMVLPLEKGELEGVLKDFYEIEHASGAAMCVRREVYEEIGLIDPFYFIYFEEIDLCRRLRYHSGKLALATRARVFHYNRLETSPIGTLSTLRFERGYLIFLLKNPFEPAVINLIRYLTNSISRTIGALGRRQYKRLWKLITINIDILVHLPQIFWRRRREMKSPQKLGH